MSYEATHRFSSTLKINSVQKAEGGRVIHVHVRPQATYDHVQHICMLCSLDMYFMTMAKTIGFLTSYTIIQDVLQEKVCQVKATVLLLSSRTPLAVVCHDNYR